MTARVAGLLMALFGFGAGCAALSLTMARIRSIIGQLLVGLLSLAGMAAAVSAIIFVTSIRAIPANVIPAAPVPFPVLFTGPLPVYQPGLDR